MSRDYFLIDDTDYKRTVRIGPGKEKRYGFFSFLFDVFMTIITYGFWLIWIFVREMRKR